MSTVKKRLHISGLTPAITSSDLITRLHGFGKVLSLDGLGMLNAVGECLTRSVPGCSLTVPSLSM